MIDMMTTEIEGMTALVLGKIAEVTESDLIVDRLLQGSLIAMTVCRHEDLPAV